MHSFLFTSWSAQTHKTHTHTHTNTCLSPPVSPDSPWSLRAHSHSQSLAARGETEHHTFSTVPRMMLFPTGMRTPPRMATTAPITAPAMSPDSLLQQPMVLCVFPSVRLCECFVCLAAGSPSVSVGGVCVCVQLVRQAVASEELTELQRPGRGADSAAPVL